MKQNIFLIGFMGCGKSTVAKELHHGFDYKIIEMDELIVQREGLSIPGIFEQKGEPYFRSLETQILREVGDQTGLVISCGGGVAMRQENVDLMKASGRIVLLTATPQTILDRVHNDDNRPLLQGKKTVADIEKLLNTRRPAYEKAADFVVTTDHKDAGEIASEIIKLLS